MNVLSSCMFQYTVWLFKVMMLIFNVQAMQMSHIPYNYQYSKLLLPKVLKLYWCTIIKKHLIYLNGHVNLPWRYFSSWSSLLRRCIRNVSHKHCSYRLQAALVVLKILNLEKETQILMDNRFYIYMFCILMSYLRFLRGIYTGSATHRLRSRLFSILNG